MPMNKHTESEQKLERVLGQALHGLPLRRAPGSLAPRVIGELERRAARPWWQASFTNWPVAARVVFVLTCAALIAATILGGVSAYLGDRSLNEAAAALLANVKPRSGRWPVDSSRRRSACGPYSSSPRRSC